MVGTRYVMRAKYRAALTFALILSVIARLMVPRKWLLSLFIAYEAKLQDADWLRQTAFYLNYEGTFGNQEGVMITWCWLAEHACIKLVSRFTSESDLNAVSRSGEVWIHEVIRARLNTSLRVTSIDEIVSRRCKLSLLIKRGSCIHRLLQASQNSWIKLTC